MVNILNVRDGRYHKNVYWPSCIIEEVNSKLLNSPSEVGISKHCRDNILKEYHKKKNSYARKYNVLDINMSFLERATCFEVLISDGEVVKAAFRASYGFKKDLCVVISFKDELKRKEQLSCVTAWINLEGNKRNDFKRSIYIGGTSGEAYKVQL